MILTAITWLGETTTFIIDVLVTFNNNFNGSILLVVIVAFYELAQHTFSFQKRPKRMLVAVISDKHGRCASSDFTFFIPLCDVKD